MANYRHKHYRFLVTIGFNIVLFYLFYVWLQRNIHLHRLISDIGQASLSSILSIFPFYFFILVIYGLRLSLLLNVSFRQSFCIIGIGNGLNNVLPFRLGDILRIYFAKRFFDIEMPQTLAATVMERYFDLIMLLILGSITLFSAQFGLEVDAIYLFIALLSCSLLSVIFYRYLVVKDGPIKNFILRSGRFHAVLTAIEAAVSKRNKLRVLLLSAALWLCLLSIYYFFFNMNLTTTHINLSGAIFLLFTTTLSFAIPYSLAGIGIFETVIVYYLIKYLHLLPTKALALALVFHFTTAFPQVILMAVIFFARQVHWLRLSKRTYLRP